MYPFIDVFGLFKLPTYGLLGAVGAIAGVCLLLFRKNHYNIKREDLLFTACFAAAGVIVGAKLLYAITVISPYLKSSRDFSFIETIQIFFGGYVFYGGLIGGILAGMLYGKIYKIPPLALADIFAPSIPLIHAFGRVGCFMAGCCFGMPSERFGVLFSAVGGAPQGIRLFPIQLVESGINFLVFALLLIYSIKKRPMGSVCGLYISIYAIERFILEYFRYDTARGSALGISTSQWISLALLPIGIALIVTSFKKEKKTAA